MLSISHRKYGIVWKWDIEKLYTLSKSLKIGNVIIFAKYLLWNSHCLVGTHNWGSLLIWATYYLVD